MGPAVYMIALLGCGEGEAPCEQIRMVETQYESQSQCLAATEAQLLRFGDDASYPVIVAQCREAGAAAEQVQPEDLLLPEPEAEHPFRRAGGTRFAAAARR